MNSRSHCFPRAEPSQHFVSLGSLAYMPSYDVARLISWHLVASYYLYADGDCFPVYCGIVVAIWVAFLDSSPVPTRHVLEVLPQHSPSDRVKVKCPPRRDGL